LQETPKIATVIKLKAAHFLKIISFKIIGFYISIRKLMQKSCEYCFLNVKN
jgi:hypothetical protein